VGLKEEKEQQKLERDRANAAKVAKSIAREREQDAKDRDGDFK
jgi:hypothetical protein